MSTKARLRAYAQRKHLTQAQAIDVLVAYALDTVDARRKGALAVNRIKSDRAKSAAKGAQS